MKAGLITLIIGHKGTGKTPWVRELVQNTGRLLVIESDNISPDWQEIATDTTLKKKKWKENIIRRRRLAVDPDNPEPAFEFCFKHLRHATIVLEDCRSYITASTGGYLRRLVIRSEHANLNILLVAHGFDEIPPFFFTHADYVQLFPTSSEISRRKGDLQNFEKWEREVNAVNSSKKSKLLKFF